ncbi:unnamed protein product [Xylocopa violacea]|uniref:Uncharacterized protein n=1 Tax=Xylocopa violacea TaxID=135666 RepID=A0ABP1P0H4_XYLVO
MVVIFVFTIPCLCDLIKQCDNLIAVINNLGYSIPLMITVMKYIVVFKKKKVLLPIVNMIAEDWAKLKTEFEEAVMVRRARVARAINIFGYTLISIMMSLMTILPRFGVTLRYVTNGTDILVESEQISMLRVAFLMGTFVNTFVQTSLYCMAGQILVSQAEGVYNAAYKCEWTNLKSNKAKKLILIMARAKRPLYITAGKLFPMTMLTFCKVRCILFPIFFFTHLSFFISNRSRY